MKVSTAVRCVAMLAAYFPAKPMSQETTAVWANELQGFDERDAVVAVRQIGTTARFLPSLADLIAEVREVERHRKASEVPALPQGEEQFVDLAEWRERHATPEQRQALTRFFARIAGGRGK